MKFNSSIKKYVCDEERIYINRSNESSFEHNHTHDFIEIAYVYKGKGHHHINNQILDVRHGDLFIIEHDCAHEFRSIDADGLVVYNCIFYPDFLDYHLIGSKDFEDIISSFLFRSLSAYYKNDNADIRLEGTSLKVVESIYDKMYSEYMVKEDGYSQMLRAYVTELIVTIFRCFKAQLVGQKPIARHQDMIDKVIGYMHENYDKSVSLQELSMLAFLSRNYFCRLFKDTTGMTAGEYLQKVRVNEAAKLLKETSHDIGTISDMVGYSDKRHFSDLFKKNMGTTPGKYRKSSN